MMSFYQRGAEKRKNYKEFQMKHEFTRPASPEGQMLDVEKRQRREVANSNERRRMQSINAGFQSLRTLIPHHQGDKLSKAAILQQTADYIAALEEDKCRLLNQNRRLHQMLLDYNPRLIADPAVTPTPKRRKRDTESSDEGIVLSDELMAMKKEPQMPFIAEEPIKCHPRLNPEPKDGHLRLIEEKKVDNFIKEDIADAHREKKFAEDDQKRLGPFEDEPRFECDIKRAPPSVPRPYLAPSKSSRNMEILLEAFRLIEGDHSLFECKPPPSSLEVLVAPPPHSEESDKESCSSDETASPPLTPRSESEQLIPHRNSVNTVHTFNRQRPGVVTGC